MKHTKCHSSVQHVSLEVKELGLVSVRYNFSGLESVRYSFLGLESGRGKGLGKRTQTTHFTHYPGLYNK